MIRNISIACIAPVAFFMATSSHAQNEPSQDTVAPSSTEAPQAAIASQNIGNILKTGTPITLRMIDTLTSKKKKQKVGDRFQLEVAQAVTVNNLIIIPAGTRATGEVTLVKKSGMWGKRGRLNARLLYLTLGDRQIRLSGAFDDSGKAGTAGVVGAVAVLPVAGFFVKGSNAEITPGTQIEAFLDEDLAFTPPSDTPPSPAPPAATPQTAPQTATITKPQTVALDTISAN